MNERKNEQMFLIVTEIQPLYGYFSHSLLQFTIKYFTPKIMKEFIQINPKDIGIILQPH